MKTNTHDHYDPDNQVPHDLASDQALLSAGFQASCVSADAATQPTAGDYAKNRRNIGELEITEGEIELTETALAEAEGEVTKHKRLIDHKRRPRHILTITGYVTGMATLGGAILVNTASYALKSVDNPVMAGAFALSVLGIAAGKELAIQSCSDEIKERAHTISKVGLLVSSAAYIYSYVNKFALEQGLDAASLLEPTDDRLLLASQIGAEICIFSLASAGLTKLLQKMKHPTVNNRRLYFENLIRSYKADLAQLLQRKLDLKEAICAFEVRRKRYEAFVNSTGK